MTFKGIYRDGIIILEDATGLRNGTVVEVNRPAKRAKATSKRTAKSSNKSAAKNRKRKSSTKDPMLKLFGIWKDRPDWKGKSTLEIQRELRAKAMGRLARG